MEHSSPASQTLISIIFFHGLRHSLVLLSGDTIRFPSYTQTSPSFTLRPVISPPAEEYHLDTCAAGPKVAEGTTGARGEIAKAGQKDSKLLHSNTIISERSAFQFSGRPLQVCAASFQWDFWVNTQLRSSTLELSRALQVLYVPCARSGCSLMAY